MIRHLTRFALPVTLVAALAVGCTGSRVDNETVAQPAQEPCPIVSVDPATTSYPPVPDGCEMPAEAVDEQQFIIDVQEGNLDCDAEDRAHRESPDCGYYIGSTYVFWQWVLAGKTRPPAHWDYRREAAAASARILKKPATGKTATVKPVAPKTPATPAATPAATRTVVKPALPPATVAPARPAGPRPGVRPVRPRR